MKEYHKIQSVFMRHEKTKRFTDEFSIPEFEYLYDCPWVLTEKVDGTNIRVIWRINILCKDDVIEYGTSPRYAWLTDKGNRLKEFILSHSVDELYDFCTKNENYNTCCPNYCNCDDKKNEEDKCLNPFFSC